MISMKKSSPYMRIPSITAKAIFPLVFLLFSLSAACLVAQADKIGAAHSIVLLLSLTKHCIAIVLILAPISLLLQSASDQDRAGS